MQIDIPPLLRTMKEIGMRMERGMAEARPTSQTEMSMRVNMTMASALERYAAKI